MTMHFNAKRQYSFQPNVMFFVCCSLSATDAVFFITVHPCLTFFAIPTKIGGTVSFSLLCYVNMFAYRLGFYYYLDYLPPPNILLISGFFFSFPSTIVCLIFVSVNIFIILPSIDVVDNNVIVSIS